MGWMISDSGMAQSKPVEAIPFREMPIRVVRDCFAALAMMVIKIEVEKLFIGILAASIQSIVQYSCLK